MKILSLIAVVSACLVFAGCAGNDNNAPAPENSGVYYYSK